MATKSEIVIDEAIKEAIKHDRYIVKVFVIIVVSLIIMLGIYKMHRDYQIAKVLIHRGSSLTVEEAFNKPLTEILQAAPENINDKNE